MLMGIIIGAVIPNEESVCERLDTYPYVQCRSAFTLYEGLWCGVWVSC